VREKLMKLAPALAYVAMMLACLSIGYAVEEHQRGKLEATVQKVTDGHEQDIAERDHLICELREQLSFQIPGAVPVGRLFQVRSEDGGAEFLLLIHDKRTPISNLSDLFQDALYRRAIDVHPEVTP